MEEKKRPLHSKRPAHRPEHLRGGLQPENGEQAPHIRKKKKKPFFIIKFVVYGVAAVVVIYAAYYAFTTAFTMGGEAVEVSDEQIPAQDVIVTIPEGSTTKEIGEILEQNGLIDSVTMFRLHCRLNGYDGTFHFGTYLLHTGMDEDQIAAVLQSGEQYVSDVRITIPEGFTLEQIAARIEENGLMTAEELIAEAENGDFSYDFLPAEKGERKYRLEGYLFPATYDVPEDATAHEVLTMMLDRYAITYQTIVAENQTGYTNDEVLILASLVESEIQVPEERAIAAGVLYNRLREGMPLQIDSTVQYAVCTRNEVVTYDDLEVDSPYNTYEHTGIPIGPICNPGDEAIQAVLHPDDNNYLYYVVERRGSGNHVFCETYDEFLAARQAYQDSFSQ